MVDIAAAYFIILMDINNFLLLKSYLNFDKANDESQSLEAGSTLSFSDATAELDLSSEDCSNLQFLCATLLRGESSSPDFQADPFTACTPATCVGLILTDVSVAQMAGSPIRELVLSSSIDLEVSLSADPNGGSVTGSDLWNFSVFLSNTSACQFEITTPVLVPNNEKGDLEAGTSETFKLEDVRLYPV